MKNIGKIVFALFAVFILIGCVNVYSNHSGYSADASIDGDGKISYSLSGTPAEYRYSVYSDTSLPDKIYFYLDDSYRSDFNDYYVQSEFFSVLKKMLDVRGYSSTDMVDAEGLVAVMSEPGSAVFFVSGALPDTIYDGSSGSLFETWMNNGGTVYWSGPELGRYISTKTSVNDIGTGLFNGKINSEFDEKTAFAYTESDMFRYTQMRRDQTGFALMKDVPDSIPLAYVDDVYSTVSVAKLYYGNAFIFGGNIAITENVSQDVTDRTCCADLMIIGLTYNSKAIDCGSGTLNGNVNAVSSEIITSYSDVTFAIYVGTPATHWAKAIRMN